MKKHILISLFSFIFSYLVFSQTVLFSESFDEANGATTGNSAEGISWTATCPNCAAAPDKYEVQSNALRGEDTNGPASFKTGNITIPAGTKYITITMKFNSLGYSGTGNLESSDECSGCSGKVEDALSGSCSNCWDFLFYKMNFGGTDSTDGILLGYKGTPDSGTLCNTVNVEGKTSFTLDIQMSMWAASEWMTFDDVKVTAYTSAQATSDSIPSSSCPITRVCNFEFVSGKGTCDSSTSGTDTYTAVFNYKGGNSGETHTVSASSGTVVLTNNPDTVDSGKITVTGVNEGTDVTLTVNTTACGDTTYKVTSPTCEPTCDMVGISAIPECDGDKYDLKIKFIHKDAKRDSVDLYVNDGTNNIDSLLNYSTTGDTQVATLTDVAVGDASTGLSVRIIEVGSSSGTSSQNPFISEIHYDNNGGDVNEKVEVSGKAGTDLSGWTIVLYNGNNGKQYSTINLSGTIDDEGSGAGALSFSKSGIQNGTKDGLALVKPDGTTVIEFLSYEGVLTATDGPANGTTSTDIGVAESGTTLSTESLQKNNSGWQAPQANSMGTLNTGLTISTSTSCTDTLTFDEPNCCDSLKIDNISDTSVCGYFVLPAITGNNLSDSVAYYSQPNGQGTKYKANDTLSTSGTYYVYDSISATCVKNDTFILTINASVEVDSLSDTTACNYFILPTITGTNLSGNEAYYSQPNAQGNKYNANDTLTISSKYYIYDSTASGCFDMDSFTLSVDSATIIDSLNDTTACSYFVLPTITGTNLSGNEAYYSQPNAQGTKYNASDTLFASGMYYMYDSISGDCFDTDSFTLTIDTAPSLDTLSDTTACNYFILPTITGTNLSGNEAYYSQPNAQGNKYNANDTLTISSKYYMYDSTASGCFDMDSFTLSVDSATIIDSLNDTTACSYFVLPTITGTNLSGNEAYYSQPNAQGSKYNVGDSLFASGMYYMYDSISGDCFDTDSFTLTIDTAPSIDAFPDTTINDYFILPTISGNNLSGGEAYYSQPNAQGNKYNANDSLNISGIYYIYDSTVSGCFDMNSFVLTVDIGTQDSLCNISIFDFTTNCNSGYYDISFKFNHENAINTDSVDVNIIDGNNVINSMKNVATTGDTQEITINSIAIGDATSALALIVTEVSDSNGTQSQTPFISEFHYDNSGTDKNEKIEITGSAGLDLTGWSVVLYNGNGGVQYNTIYLSGSIDDEGGGFGALEFDIEGASFQNGPDGLALVNADNNVIEFLSYEGVFAATDGPANGLTSTDIGVSESSATDETESLQKNSSGWQSALTNTMGDLNTGLITNSTDNCSDTITFDEPNCCDTISVTALPDTTVDDYFILPTITGTNLSGNEAYYSQPNAQGNKYNANDSLIISGTYYIYDSIVSGCFDMDSFTLSINIQDSSVIPCSIEHPIVIENPGDQEDSFNISSLEIVDTSFVNETITYHNEVPSSAIDYSNLTENTIFNSQVIYVMVAEVDKGCFSVDSVAITIVNLDNNLPVAQNDNYEGEMNDSIKGNIMDNDVDLDKEEMSIKIVTQPQNGTLVMNSDGTFVFYAFDGFIGLDIFTYEICDAEGCDEASVNLLIRGNSPTAVDDYYYGEINYTIDGIVGINDLSNNEGATLTFSKTTEPVNGTVEFNTDGSFAYSPNNNFSGIDSFSYQVCNAAEQCDTATVYIQVICDNFRDIELAVPNILTPNLDGLNDVWYIPELYTYRHCYKRNEVIVFNRWEEKVFHRYNYGFEQLWWDGMSESSFVEVKENNLLPSGTYYYIIKLGNNWDDALTGFIHIQY